MPSTRTHWSLSLSCTTKWTSVSIHVSICLSIHDLACLSVCPSVCPFICQFKSHPYHYKTLNNLYNTAQNVASKAEDFAHKKTDQTVKDIQFHLKSDAVGQYLKTDILDQDDEIFASVGDIVTQEILIEAQENDQLDKLLANLSKDPI